MAPKKLKYHLLILNLLLFCAVTLWQGCKEDFKYPAPTNRLVIYKTKSDYFNNVQINLKDGKVYYKPSYWGKMDSDSSGTPYYRSRVKLHQGYILGTEEGYPYTVFLSYIIKDYYRMETDPVSPTIPTIQELTEHIIDRDPFSEFYIDLDTPPYFQVSDSTMLNQIIDEGKLQKFFKKVK